MQSPMTYEGSGVNYADLDPFKREAMAAAATTVSNMERRGFEEIGWSRGESCYLFRHKKTGLILAFVIEGLGSANKVAEDPALRDMFKKTFYHEMAITNAAMNFNDMITVGALPVVFALHPAVESGAHLGGQNGTDLIDGTVKAATSAGCTLGPGETPGLRDIIVPGTMCLSGACVGIVNEPAHLMSSDAMRAGLRIILLASTGLHGNGYTLCRRLAARLPHGYLTDIGDGILFGEALMNPTRLYVGFTEACQRNGTELVYGVNITGHGWRKLMRARKSLTYVIDRTPEIPPLFRFIMEQGPVELREMYGTFNMGAGYAVFVEPKFAESAIHIAHSLGIDAIDAGPVVDGDRKVVIRPHGLEYTELDLR